LYVERLGDLVEEAAAKLLEAACLLLLLLLLPDCRTDVLDLLEDIGLDLVRGVGRYPRDRLQPPCPAIEAIVFEGLGEDYSIDDIIELPVL